MTAEELIRLPDDGLRHELIKGELLTISPSGAQHGAVTLNLSVVLATYVKTKKLGVVFWAETGFKLEQRPDTVLAPDIGFVSKARIGSLPQGFLQLAPDLAVEVISSSKSRSLVEKKTAQWLSFGAKSVWQVHCQNRTVDVIWANGFRKQFVETDELCDDDVVAGFRVVVAQLFN